MGKRRRGVSADLGIVDKIFCIWQSRPFFIIAFLFSIILRLYLINLRKFPASDEIWAYLLIRADFKSIWFATLSDFHPPFYFLFLRALQFVLPFDLSIFFIRIISLIFGIIASFAVWVLASKVLGKKVGLAVFYLSLFLPGFIWASIYGRYYSFLILLATVSIILFLNYLKTMRLKNLVLLVIILVLGTYTHYYFFFIDVVFFLFLLSVGKFRFLLKNWVLATTLVIFACIPAWIYFLILSKPELTGRGYNFILKLPSVLIVNLTSFETFLYLYYQGKPIFYFPVLILLFVTTVFLLVYTIVSWKSQFKLLFLYLFLVPPTILIAVSYMLNKPVLALGSLVIFLPAILVLIGQGLGSVLKRFRIISLIFTVCLLLSLIFFFQSSNTYSVLGRDFQFISDNLQDGDIIINSHLGSFLMSTYYLGTKAAILGTGDEKTSTYPTQQALGYKVITAQSLAGVRSRIWYLEPYYGATDEARKIKQELDNNFKLVQKEVFIPEKEYKGNFSFFNVYLYVPVNQ